MLSPILVRDGTLYLSLTDPELMEAVTNATSFQIEGAEFRGRDNRADKRTKLVRNQKAPVGLLDRICRTMVLAGFQPEVSYANSEVAPKPRVSMSIQGIVPRPYQLEAQAAAVFNDRGIFRMPTGSGKTLVTAMVAAVRGYPAVVIVPTIDLLHQTRDEFSGFLAGSAPAVWNVVDKTMTGGWQIGQLGDGVVNPQPITIATIRTMARVLDVAYESYEFGEYDDSDDTQVNRTELRAWVEALGTVIVDEAHQLGAKTLYETVTKIPAICKFGFSASPWRDDGADLMIEAATGPAIYHVTAKRLVKEDWLLAPEFRVIDTSAWWQSRVWGQVCKRCKRQRVGYTLPCACGSTSWESQYNDAYREEIVKNEVRNTQIAALVMGLNRPTLILVKQIAHGKNLTRVIPGSVFLTGRDRGKDRKATFDAVRSGHQLILIATTIADQGLDIPSLGALVLAAGGKSSTRHLQRIGRVVRPAKGKVRPVVIDFDDSHVHTWFSRHAQRRRQIEFEEWGDTGAEWTYE